MRKGLQTVVLTVYRTVAAAGLLETPWIRACYERTYFLYKGLVEARNVRFLRAWVRPGTSAIDVGANIGFFTLHLARWVSEGGRVLALEPDTVNFARLRRAVSRAKIDSRVEAIQAAVAEAPGEAFLELNPHNPADHKLGVSGVGVALTSIDDLLRERNWPAVSLIKIDVQGAEPRVLAGARGTIAKFRPAIFVEVHDASLRRYGSNARDFLGSCLTLGYTLRVLSRRTVSPALTVEQVLGLERQQGYIDVLLLPADDSRPR